jgi:hypothetical protein
LLIIDRFEGEWAVIEYNRRTFNLPRILLPMGVREGDVINIHITIDQTKTAQLKLQIKQQTDNLFEE